MREAAVKHVAHTLGKAQRQIRYALSGNVAVGLAWAYLLALLAAALLARVLPIPDPNATDLANTLADPFTPGHLLGTDVLGRDILSRLIHGAQTSLKIAVLVVAAAGAFGTLLGTLGGFYGRWVDRLVTWLVDLQMSFPGLLIALTWVLVLGVGERNLIIALAFNGWMIHARYARSLVLSLRETPFVEAGVAIGLRTPTLIARHILPNILPKMTYLYVLEMGRILLAESVMSYLGYGVQPPSTSWGLMIAEGQDYLPTDPHLVLFPGLALMLAILSCNIVADWLLEQFDPLRGRSRVQRWMRFGG